MIRTADASGVGAVVCCEGSVDPTNPKTVRSSAGSLFHVPVVAGGPPEAVLAALRGWGFTTVGTLVHNGLDYTTFDWKQKVAVVFGNEASGLGPSVVDALDATVSIPMAGRAESLNVGVSAAVLCFEAMRQRRGDGWSAGAGARRPTMPDMESASMSPPESDGGHPVDRDRSPGGGTTPPGSEPSGA